MILKFNVSHHSSVIKNRHLWNCTSVSELFDSVILVQLKRNSSCHFILKLTWTNLWLFSDGFLSCRERSGEKLWRGLQTVRSSQSWRPGHCQGEERVSLYFLFRLGFHSLVLKMELGWRLYESSFLFSLHSRIICFTVKSNSFTASRLSTCVWTILLWSPMWHHSKQVPDLMEHQRSLCTA